MNILFLSIGNLSNLNNNGLYPDLLREFKRYEHQVYVACATQTTLSSKLKIEIEAEINILRIPTGKLNTKNMIKKGILTLLIEPKFKKALKKCFSGIKFDLVIYTTPPITFYSSVKYIKKRDNAKTYLLLKDIFPQNAVDLGMMTKKGPKSVIYKMFRKKEERLYQISDYIGCMSKANVDYIIKHNPYINPEKVHINPNSIDVQSIERSAEKREEIREKYNIPQEATVFVYGGNLGRPQDIPFVIKCLKQNIGKNDRFFVICGKGTDYPKLKAFVESEKPDNVLLLNGLPKEEYEEFIKAFDIGLIFLDRRFEIPNFPSRLLSYMQNSMPVLACTDKNTDIGKVITENGFGWWCESNSTADFTATVDNACKSNPEKMGKIAKEYLLENYTSKNSYETILEKVGEK